MENAYDILLDYVTCCVPYQKYRVRQSHGKIKRGLLNLIFQCDCQPEVHIFDMEHNMDDMNFFLNRYNVKTQQKPSKQEKFEVIFKNVTS